MHINIENGFSKTDGNIILNSSGACEPWTNASPAGLTFTNDTVYWLFKITNKTKNAIVVSVLDTEGNALSNLNGKMNLINTYGKNADTVPDSNESFEVTQNDIIYVLIALEMQEKKSNFRQDWSFVVHIENPATAAFLLMSWQNKIRYKK